MNNDLDVILMALQKQRDKQHKKLMQLDRIIKKVREGEYEGNRGQDVQQLTVQSVPQLAASDALYIPKGLGLKVQVLRVFDIIGRVSSLKEINTEYTKLTGNKYNLRETVRSLHHSNRLKLIREKGKDRGHYWTKTEWIDNGQLLDKYKFLGFDLIYMTDNLIFE